MSLNYGTCFYTPGEEPGTLKATWRAANLPAGEVGTGLAVGGPTDGGLAGAYHVTYYAPDGSEDAAFDLLIEQTGDTFSLKWLIGSDLKCEGIGIAVAGGIVLAYVPPQ